MAEALYPEVVLASASPRRTELLRAVGISFRVVPAAVDEDAVEADNPAELVEKLAVTKARQVADRFPHAIVLGADTIVVCDQQVLGKPRDEEDAVRMLGMLSGRGHTVITGVALIAGTGPCAGRTLVAHETTQVYFRSLSPQEIAAYVATKEPADKAGAYGVQGRGALFVTRIEGCYFNVVGLPLARVGQMLSACGVPLF